MRERASMTRVGSITGRRWKEPLAAVGKPYKLPAWSTVCGDLLAVKRTLSRLENRSDSTGDCLSRCDSNRRTRYESAPRTREVPHFRQLAKRPPNGVPGLRGLAGGVIAFRTARCPVPTTFSRGKDDHHRDLFPFRGGEIYFWRSEFWTERREEEKRRISLKVAGRTGHVELPRPDFAGCGPRVGAAVWLR
jgi:hypothetical protein